MANPLICIKCRSGLEREPGALVCPRCGARYPVVDDIADFSGGHYYDQFEPEQDRLTAEHLHGLELEIDGSIRRMRDYYIPLMRKTAPTARRVLDVGCGNGVSVDTLRSAGFDAWGNDLSQLRKHQWKERSSREFLVVASALALPFPDDYFDVVISSGVIEHIGVAETPAPRYSASAAPNQRALRAEFLRELGRVTRTDGRIFLDFPNGRFPIDFWHGNAPGSPRFHSPRERFLPSFGEVKEIARATLPDAVVRPRSPRRRLQFKQAAGHLHGRVLWPAVALLFTLMDARPFRWLAGSPINPFLVVEIEKVAHGEQARP